MPLANLIDKLDDLAARYPVLGWLVVMAVVAAFLVEVVPAVSVLDDWQIFKTLVVLILVVMLLKGLQATLGHPQARAPVEGQPARPSFALRLLLVGAVAAAVAISATATYLWVSWRSTGYSATNAVHLECKDPDANPPKVMSDSMASFDFRNEGDKLIVLERARSAEEHVYMGSYHKGEKMSVQLPVGTVVTLHDGLAPPDNIGGGCIEKLRVDPAWWRVR